MRRRALAIAFGLAAFASASSSREARAAEPQQDTADGITACRQLQERNTTELAAWEKTQPPQPFVYPRPQTILDAPWSPIFSWTGANLDLVLATAIPHLGAELRGDGTPATTLSWPWSFPIGPAFSCSRKTGTFNYMAHRANRLMLEPGIVLSDQGLGFRVRPGYRFIYHPTDFVVGFGGGLGSTLEIVGNKEPFRASIGPEAVLHFGHCCERSYFTLALRYDYFPEGKEAHIIGANLGYVYF